MKIVCVRSFFVVAALAMTAAPCAGAVGFTLTMDDLPRQPVHGLIHPSGLQFGFTVGGTPSLEAEYAAFGPGPIVFVQDPSIEGPSNGVLSMTFPLPTPVLRFGVARLTGNTTAAVELFNAANASLGVTNLVLTAMPDFGEGQFNYNGPAVKRATISFVAPETRFAFDNLFFLVVPEPASCVLVGCAELIWLMSRANLRRRISRSSSRPHETKLA